MTEKEKELGDIQHDSVVSGGDEKSDNGKSDRSSGREHDLEALRATQKEARAVLDHQIQTFNDVDNKAAKTSRLNGLLLGLLLTAASFLAQAEAFDVAPYFNIYTGLGVVLLIISFILAITTYTTTNIETGVGPNDIRRLVDKRYSEKGWLILLLRSEAAWMEENERRQTINGSLLTASHVALILAILLIAGGVASVHWPF